MTSLPISPVLCLTDNYAWCIKIGEGEAVVVDPGVAEPVQRWLDERKLRLRSILLTHHHGDHTGGAIALRQATGASIVGAGVDAHRLPPLDWTVQDGDQLELGPHRAQVLAVPGHTSGHVAYQIADALFAGDVLFAFGCGRVFEGSPAQMWASLDRLRQLPATTRLYSGHEYTTANLRFARKLLPDDPGLAEAAIRCIATRQERRPTLPTPMGEQRRLNPFLRCDDPELMAALDLEGRSPAEVFAHIRGMKDRF